MNITPHLTHLRHKRENRFYKGTRLVLREESNYSLDPKLNPEEGENQENKENENVKFDTGWSGANETIKWSHPV